MRLILDEHYSARIAVELRKRGHDAIAVTEVGALRQIADEDLLRWAGAERRVLVTEDASDFLPIHARLVSSGESHQGIVLTSHRRFPTSSAGIGSLVAALHELLTSAGGLGGQSEVRWL